MFNIAKNLSSSVQERRFIHVENVRPVTDCIRILTLEAMTLEMHWLLYKTKLSYPFSQEELLLLNNFYQLSYYHIIILDIMNLFLNK